ncbi:baseplate J/gp47 family protein [Tateyamaria pelophila]|uniref:hypothetical protein n=1 Tax=Tateyamaria pelophila TaxID=328415 RepID=UPI001CC15E53|nr:hypothetical protein [Tateyamaria pelophila]
MSNGPIRIGHPDPGQAPDTCGCCEGTALATLQPTDNRPNLSAIAFRVGDHARFKASMLTSLASSAYPALGRLRTREDDDFSVALIDAWAATCDVLTFYQERYANEAYMGTATERLSVGELSRLIGYRLHPGAAAETDLVILMEDPPSAAPDVANLTVPEGTRVQSQPGPEEDAQVFETIETLQAQVAWNALKPRQARPILPANGDSFAWLTGTPALQVGDLILFVSRERWDSDFAGSDDDSMLWDSRRITAVSPHADGTRTLIRWNAPLDSVDSGANGPTAGLKLFHLRDRVSLFGFNAPHPLVLSEDQRENFGFDDSSGIDMSDWTFSFPGDPAVHLDNVYKSFVAGSWMVLESPNGVTQPFRIQDTRDEAVADYAISGKALRLDLDTNGSNLALMLSVYRGISAYGGSQELSISDKPLVNWVAGNAIELGARADGLPKGRKLILRGPRPYLQVTAQIISITADDGAIRAVLRGEIVTLMAEPQPDGSNYIFRISDETGFVGTTVAPQTAFEPVPAPKAAEEIVETAILEQVFALGPAHSQLVLTAPLNAAFDRSRLTIHANVARAAHGEGVTEILGHGDPSQPFQKFLLKQAPVTHRLATTESGVASTLSVRVDGVEWEEVPDLYQRGPTERVFKTALTDAGETVVTFGDGISGARPGAGRDNIVAEHSRGLGAAGNLRPGQLKLLLDRPLGMKDVDNPIPATGGADPVSASDARRNAPIYTLTLGRVVSLTDYRDFALGYPGIAKAEARWVWQGETRRIVVTVAGHNGATVPPGSTTHTRLLGAFRELGDPLVAVDLLSYQPATFKLGLRVLVDGAYETDTVLAATEAHLRTAFTFEARDFGQVLSLSAVAASAHRVDGVKAVDIDRFSRSTAPQTNPFITYARLISQTGRLGSDGTLLPAEILTLDPGPLAKLEVMA